VIINGACGETTGKCGSPRRLNLALYLENLFDIQYCTGAVSAFQIYPGAPFNVRGALSWTF